MDAVNLIYKNTLANYIKECTDYINQYTSTNILLESNEEIINKIWSDKRNDTRKNVIDKVKVREMKGGIKSAIPFFNTFYNSSKISAVETHDLTNSTWTQFVINLGELSKKTTENWTSKKKEMLFGKKFSITEFPMGKMVHVNPQIEFIQCNIIRETMTDTIKINDSYRKDYVTIDTYNEFYLPIITTAVDKMISKGYADKSWQWHSDSVDMSYKNLIIRKNSSLSTAYSNNLATLLDNQIMKLYCKAVTIGTEFPSDLKF
jgi:hypothetical protein